MAIFPQRQHITDEFGEIQNDHLIGGFNPKNITQLGLLFPIYGKIKAMFQTTNQPSVRFQEETNTSGNMDHQEYVRILRNT
jgi:hypothetical protein